MLYVKSVKIKNESYNGVDVLKKGFSFECADVNLFVGDQGTGKSTLLSLLQKNDEGLDIITNKPAQTFYFDTEKDNPRTKDPELYTTPSGANVGMGYGEALVSRFKSHGEILRSMVIDPLFNAADCVILIDEPESGLSLKSQFELLDAIDVAVKNNCQLFLATHCYPLIKKYGVISFDDWECMSGEDYINRQEEGVCHGKE